MKITNAAVIVESRDCVSAELDNSTVHLVEWNGEYLYFSRTCSSIEEAKIVRDLEGKKGPIFDHKWCKQFSELLYNDAIYAVKHHMENSFA